MTSASDESLSALFDNGFALHRSLSNSCDDPRSDQFQENLRKSILILEDATRLVSVLDVFSRNERVDEVPGEHLKYFLLPVLLGDLHGKLLDEGNEREEVIRIQEVYLRDFLQRCNDYGICNVQIESADGEGQGGEVMKVGKGPPDMAKMTQEREAKMRRYREQKELEKRLDELQAVLGHADEDLVREYYLKTIQRFVNWCQDELVSFKSEKSILEHMKLVKAGKAEAPKQEKRRPLKPIIITRDAAQKEVFGLGYKNLPIFSIEEFYEQRVKDGWFPPPVKAGQSLQGRLEVDPHQVEDDEAQEKEEKEEREDEDELRRKRDWDEYKDDHRRGEGNRHNMG